MKKFYKKIFAQEKKLNIKLKAFLVDDEYYYEMNPEVIDSGESPLEHYDRIGWKKLNNPSLKFDTARYLEEHQDVNKSKLNPLNHYATHGYLENREIFPVNEIDQIVDGKLVSAAQGDSQIDNPNHEGILNSEGCNHHSLELKSESAIEVDCLLNFLFDAEYYLSENPDVVNAGIDPYEHFTHYGWKEYRNPSIHFNVNQYLQMNEDIKLAEINPLLHYVNFGRHEGRKLFAVKQSDDRYMNAYYELNSMHSGYSASPEYAPCIKAPVIVNKDAPKVIAFYLPQFHPFEENDKWWGKGFTEWTNVAKAVPQFEGHYQPRLPSDLGYYDLRLTEVMAEQTKMAAAHGVDGFCFHYYWFAGHRLMERPIEQYLAEKENLNFPFCLCWANENWTRRWDGSENDILMAQEHSESDNEAVFYDLLRYFKDERYITVEGKPVLVIYRPDIIPDINGLTTQIRKLAIKEGFPGIHLVATNAFGFDQHRELGFDAIVEFPPHNVQSECINYDISTLNNDFSGYVFKYDDVIDYSLERIQGMDDIELAKGYYPTVMTGWDNSARKPGKGNIFHGATPAKFQNWLEGCYLWSKETHPKESQFVFINAWNEWAEGTYLEPDKKYGYAYLNAVRTTVNEVLNDAKQLNNFASTVTAKKQSNYIVVAHVFYEDLVDEICDEIILAQKYKKLDVALSIPNSFSLDKAKQLVKRLRPVKLIVSENRGRDVWPFLQTLTAINKMDYLFGCKIHSKKSTHIAKGNEWRRSLYSGLLSEQAISDFDSLTSKSEKSAIIAPKDFICELDGYNLRDNLKNLEKLMSIYNVELTEFQDFVAGTMFWFSFNWANKLEKELVNRELFGPELGAIDGTVAHAFERFFTTHAREAGFEVSLFTKKSEFLPY